MNFKCKKSLKNSIRNRYLYLAGNMYMGIEQGCETIIKDETGTNHLFDVKSLSLYFTKKPDNYCEADDESGIEVNVIVKIT